jgi:hypothetical protein
MGKTFIVFSYFITSNFFSERALTSNYQGNMGFKSRVLRKKKDINYLALFKPLNPI